MSSIRQQNNPLIIQLLREHDSLAPEQQEARQTIQRRILFLMTTIKFHELEVERSLQKPKARLTQHAWPSNTSTYSLA
jgi:hypothetical protein